MRHFVRPPPPHRRHRTQRHGGRPGALICRALLRPFRLYSPQRPLDSAPEGVFFRPIFCDITPGGVPLTYSLACASCERNFTAASPFARTCSDGCRAKLYRTRLTAQRARLAAQASDAASRGDLAELTAVAERAAALLAA